jgi:ElaB/YqjD/DUF883 family membrane-anchored ribosome-binding protein
MDDQNVIREQMQDTRSALSEKLEILEDRVSSTVKDATHEVSETVEAVTDSVQETVDSVKETVADTITAVKGSVDAVKGFFDLPSHANRYPWLVLGGSVAFGFFIGELLLRSRTPHPRSLGQAQPPRQDPVAAGTPAHNGQGNGRMDNGNEPAKESLLDQIAPDLSALKGLAVGALMGTVREMAAKAAGESLGQPLSEIIDSVTKKMGGKPIASKPQEDAAPDAEAKNAASKNGDASQQKGRNDESWQKLTGKR